MSRNKPLFTDVAPFTNVILFTANDSIAVFDNRCIDYQVIMKYSNRLKKDIKKGQIVK